MTEGKPEGSPSGKGRNMMKKKFFAGLVLALMLMTLTLTAFASGTLYDQNWYYQNRGKPWLENSPEIYGAVLNKLVKNPEQEPAVSDLVNVTVQDVSWVPEAQLMTVSFRAAPKDPEHYELHCRMDLDTDGAYAGRDASTTVTEDGEDRAMHWLWRVDPMFEQPTRIGPPIEMMDDSSKHLLLIEDKSLNVSDGGLELTGSRDMFRTPEGEVIFQADVSLDWLNKEFDRNLREWAEKQDAKEYAEKRIAAAQKAREAVKSGKLACVLNINTVEYTEGMDDDQLYMGGENGQLHFTVDVKGSAD